MAPGLLPGALGVAEAAPLDGVGACLEFALILPPTGAARMPSRVDIVTRWGGGGLLLRETAGPRGTSTFRSFMCKVARMLIREPKTDKTWVLEHPKLEPFPKG